MSGGNASLSGSATKQEHYHAFLSHNGADKSLVEALANELENRRISCWLDKWNLVAGDPWQPAIEKALVQCDTCVVFFGPHGLGPWHNEEMRMAIQRRVNSSERRFRVLPVILPGGQRAKESEVPGFLQGTTWVAFRLSIAEEDALHRLICGIKGIAPGRRPGAAILEGECPYLGLKTFQPEDAPLFFGRAAKVEELIDRLRKNFGTPKEERFLALIGASGSGKSSLALAGLNPSVQRGELPESAKWALVRCRPGARPWENLQIALSTNPQIALHMAALPALIIHPEDEQRRLHLTSQLALHNQPETHRLFILIDQFEETFTLCKDEADRAKFLDNILYATNVAGGRTIVMLTMRADFYAQCAAYQGLRAAVSDHQSLIGPLSEQELREVIERPAQLAGGELEPGLMELLLADMEGRPSALPFLEHALEKLWELRDGRRLLAKAYTEMGRLEGALDAHAEKFYTETLTADEQPLCRQIMVDLVRPGEGSADTKKRVPIGELASTHVKREVLRKLTDARLVTTDGEIEATAGQAELAHEALISGWQRLGDWVNENREFLLWRQRLSGLLAVWKKAQESAEALLRGPFLIEAQKWFDQRSQDLSDPERKLISASREERERLAREDKERQEHQLETARKLAEAQRERAEEAEKRAKEQKEAASKLRRRALVTAGAAGVALILLVVSVFLWRKSESASAKALEQAQIAAVQRNAAEEQARIAESRRLAAESTSVLTKYPQRSALLAVEAVKAEQPLHGVRVAAAEQSLRDALGSIGGRLLAQTGGLVLAVAISPDNRWVVTGGDDRTVRLWDLKDPGANPVVLRGHEREVTAVAVSPDNRWLVTGSGDKTARLWDLKAAHPTADPVVLRGHDGPVNAVAISADSRWVVTGSDDSTARIWDLSAKDPAANPVILSGHGDPILAVAISPNGHWVITGSKDRTARLWDLRAKDPRANPVVLRGHEKEVTAVAVSPDSRWVITSSDDSTARIWDLSAEDPAASPIVLRGHDQRITAVAISPDDRWVVTASVDKTARLWDLNARDPAASSVILRGHDDPVTAVAVSPDSRWVVTGSYDHTARLWDLSAKDPAASPVVLRGHDGPVWAVTISPDSRWVVTGSWDHTARLWNLTAKSPTPQPMVLHGHESFIDAVAISPDSRWAITGSSDNTARLWDLSAKDPAANSVVLGGHNNFVQAVAFSPDSRWAITGSSDDTARLWDLSAKDPAANSVVLRGHESSIKAVAVSPDGRWVVTGSNDYTARLWDLRAKDPTFNSVVLRGHKSSVEAVAISPDNRWVVTASADNTARLWDLNAKDPAANSVVLGGHNDFVEAVAVSPDSRWVVTGSSDCTARLWDLRAKDPAASPIVLRGHESWITAVGFSTDNRWAVTGSWDCTARLWDLRAKDPAASPIILRGHEDWITAVGVSTDNRWAVTGSRDNTARLWDLRAKDPAASPIILRGHNETSLPSSPGMTVVSPNNRWVLTSSEDFTARLWLLQVNDLVDLARTIVGRNFSTDEWQLYFPDESYRKTFSNLPGP
jgi:WD40 repeat protein